MAPGPSIRKGTKWHVGVHASAVWVTGAPPPWLGPSGANWMVSHPMKPWKVMGLLIWNVQPASWAGGEQLTDVKGGPCTVIRTADPAGSVPPVRSTPQMSVWPAATVPLGPGPEHDVDSVTGPGWPPADAGTAAATTPAPRTRLKRIPRHPNESPRTVPHRGNASKCRCTEALTLGFADCATGCCGFASAPPALRATSP